MPRLLYVHFVTSYFKHAINQTTPLQLHGFLIPFSIEGAEQLI
jgi:hypothetical protein